MLSYVFLQLLEWLQNLFTLMINSLLLVKDGTFLEVIEAILSTIKTEVLLIFSNKFKLKKY